MRGLPVVSATAQPTGPSRPARSRDTAGCHDTPAPSLAPARGVPLVAVVGNPNTGKTTLFNALAGMRQHVGNHPGVTVETKKGRLTHQGRPLDLVDLPGTYSLAPRSPDEMVAVDLILGQQAGEPRPDVVLTIVDASNLERNLYLTTQVLELGVPVVIALNMVDVAEGQGLQLDVPRLEKQLGVPVVAIQANKGKGLDRLEQAIRDAVGRAPPTHRPAFPEAFEREASVLARLLGEEVPPYLVRRLLLDVYTLVKALYEVRYELANRPEWVAWPMAALSELLTEREPS